MKPCDCQGKTRKQGQHVSLPGFLDILPILTGEFHTGANRYDLKDFKNTVCPGSSDPIYIVTYYINLTVTLNVHGRNEEYCWKTFQNMSKKSWPILYSTLDSKCKVMPIILCEIRTKSLDKILRTPIT